MSPQLSSSDLTYLTGDAVVPIRRKQKKCSFDGCPTVLSMYNTGKACFLHKTQAYQKRSEAKLLELKSSRDKAYKKYRKKIKEKKKKR